MRKTTTSATNKRITLNPKNTLRLINLASNRAIVMRAKRVPVSIKLEVPRVFIDLFHGHLSLW